MGSGLNSGECDVLRSVFKLNCPHPSGSPPAYSYYENGVGKGCWLAHTLLTVVEAFNLASEVGGSPLLSKVKPELLLAAALLHDVGKLSKDYINRGGSYHNLISAIVSLNVLKRWPNEEGCVVAQAVLLHHESRMWRVMFSRDKPLTFDCYSLVKKISKQIEMTDKYSSIIDMLGNMLRSLKFLEEAKYVETLNGLLDALRELKFPLKLETDEEKTLCKADLAPRSLPIYYLLQMADNRAAFARERSYWRFALDGAAESFGDDIEEFTDGIIDTFKGDSRIFLTLTGAKPRILQGALV
ncbi:MAG: HD domain-containing protein [Thermofilaceae archaeon]|nr:HD domain-containing protein [Thermofilaceae archaeon]